jgi:hypothetical protein
MEETRIALSRIIDLKVPASWHEAVALVQDLGAEMVASATAPDLGQVLLTTDGQIKIQPGAYPGHANGRFLADILVRLLDGRTAPAELRTLVSSHVERTDTTIAGLTGELSYFGRPNRRAEIAALVQRALATEAQRAAEAEFERLRSLSAESGKSTAEKKDKSPASRRPFPVKPVAGAVAALVVVAILGLGARLLEPNAASGSATPNGPSTEDTAAATASAPATSGTNGSSSAHAEPATATPAAAATAAAPPDMAAPTAAPAGEPPPGLVTRATRALDRLADAGMRAIGLSAPLEPSPAPAPPPDPAPVRRPRQTRRAADSRPAGPAAVTTVPLRAADIVASAPGAAVSLDVPIEFDEEAFRAALETLKEVYTEGDVEVTPPILLRPQMPTEPRGDEIPRAQGFLELLVNERGDVDQVRLRSFMNRHQGRMMVMAAKAWQFSPALRNGRPVKYVLSIPITQ